MRMRVAPSLLLAKVGLNADDLAAFPSEWCDSKTEAEYDKEGKEVEPGYVIVPIGLSDRGSSEDKGVEVLPEPMHAVPGMRLRHVSFRLEQRYEN